MAKPTKKAVLEARQDAAAPFLFDERNMPLRADVLESVVKRSYESTGARLLDSDIEAQKLVDHLCRGAGVRKTADLMGYSPHTIRAARRALVAQGKLAPLKERFVAKCDEIIEDGADAVLDAIHAGKMPASFIGSTVGIFFDKRALAMGEPTAISVAGTAKLRPESLSVSSLNTWLSGLPVESQSTGKAEIHAQITDAAGVAAAFDADAARRTGPESGSGSGQEASAAEKVAGDADGGGGDGGGGVAAGEQV